MAIERLCKDCGNCFYQYSTTQTRCPKCAYNRYNRPRRPIKRIGKVSKAWIATRNEWLKNNPPDHAGYYECALCGRAVHIDEVTVDHILPRSNRQDLRYDPANLQPAHGICNSKKGSKH